MVAPAPAASTAPARPKGAAATGTDKPESNEDESPRPRDASPWTITFAVTSLALLISLGFVWTKVLDRDRTIQANKNRMEQVNRARS